MKRFYTFFVICLTLSFWFNIANAQVVNIPDTKLASAVREALNLGPNARLTQQKVKQLTELKAPDSQISDLTGLEQATQLTRLDLQENQISDLSPLTDLKKLRRLDIWENQIRDITPLAGLTNLTRLFLNGNQIQDITSIAGLTKLRRLNLSHNTPKIQDITSLSSLTKLDQLRLVGNQISDVSPLAGLVNLETLHLSENPIHDTRPLANLPKLRDVDIRIATGVILDLNLEDAVRKALNLGPNARITEQELRKLTELRASSSPRSTDGDIKDLTGLEHAIELKSLDLRGNSIRDVGPLAGLTKLETLYLAYNPIIGTGPLFPLLKKNPNLRLDINPSIDEHPPIYWLTDATYQRSETNEIISITSPIQLQRQTSVSAAVETLWESSGSVDVYDTSIVADPVMGKLYWAEQIDESRSQIWHANLAGDPNVQKLATIDSLIDSIAVDPKQGKLYWTNNEGQIQRANLNGNQVKTLVENLENPQTIAVDVEGGKLYWTESSKGKGYKIQRANVNGKKIQNVTTVPSATWMPRIAIAGRKIYWFHTTGSDDRYLIQRANLNGSNIEELVNVSWSDTPEQEPEYDILAILDFAVDAAGETLYYPSVLSVSSVHSGESFFHILRTDLNSSESEIAVYVGGGDGSAQPIRIALGAPLSVVAAASVNNSLANSETAIPDTTRLLANYPNPFNPETWIPYQLSKASDVKITIYDARGIVVRRLELGHQPAGTYTSRSRAAYWDGRNGLGERVASGIYFYQLQADNVSSLRKMLILK